MKDNGGPAFPVSGTGTWILGMTLRQFYKGMAVMGCMANPDYTTASHPAIVEACRMLADALIAEDREEEK